MKKKVVVVAPVFNSSGYSNHARVLLEALKEIEDKVDLYLIPTQWAQSGVDTNEFENKEWFTYLAHKHQINIQTTKLKYDISFQLMIPHEWNTDIADYNIGVTALVETDKISAEWLVAINKMNKVLTISSFNKDTILSSVYNTEQGVIALNDKEKIGLVTFPVREEFISIDAELATVDSQQFEFESNFNFLTCAQIGPRKNVEQTILWFVQAFHSRSDVGLVCKFHMMNNSTIDKDETIKNVQNILKQFPERKCKLYLIHGNLSDRQIHSLYVHPKIKAIVTTTHGESWGLPLFEAAYMGLPVVAPKFSGYLDFLLQEKDVNGKMKRKPFFADVDFVLKGVAPEHVWHPVIIQGSLWAYPNESSFKNRLLEINKDYNRFKTQALKLKEVLRVKYSKDVVNKQYIDSLKDLVDLSDNYDFEDVVVK